MNPSASAMGSPRTTLTLMNDWEMVYRNAGKAAGSFREQRAAYGYCTVRRLFATPADERREKIRLPENETAASDP